MLGQLAFCCPACRSAVALHNQSYICGSCRREYPILLGIPDFRLRADRYLSLAEERAKAAALHAAAASMSFDELLRYYYQITEDVTADRARHFADYVRRGASRAALAIEDFGSLGANGRLLDIGCGAGGALLALDQKFADVVGLDIALRWLVICRKRLDEAGVSAALVCADIESPPFAPQQFSHALAMDVAEHVHDVDLMLSAIRAQLRAGGMVWLSANNRRWVGPHPSVGIWAAGYLPGRLRVAGKRDNRYDPLRFTTQLSPSTLRGACIEAGFEVLRVEPRRLGAPRDVLTAGYAALRANALTRSTLTAFGPTFQILARAP